MANIYLEDGRIELNEEDVKKILDERLTVVDNMKQYGGSFIVSLAEAIVHADMRNLLKIRYTWAKEWEVYLNW